jgi:hypothetical protein
MGKKGRQIAYLRAVTHAYSQTPLLTLMRNARDWSEHCGWVSGCKWAVISHIEYEEITCIKAHFEGVSFPLPDWVKWGKTLIDLCLIIAGGVTCPEVDMAAARGVAYFGVPTQEQACLKVSPLAPTYLHILQLTGNSQTKSCDSASVVLGAQDVVLTGHTNLHHIYISCNLNTFINIS